MDHRHKSKELKTARLLEEILGANLCDLGSRPWSVRYDTKKQKQKKKIDRSKFKRFCASKDTSRK